MIAPRLFACVALASLSLAACASSYAPESMTGGFSERQTATAEWWVAYAGNGYTSEETVQTYWLYHCAELTLAKGYAGFELVDPIQLSAAEPTVQRGLIRIESSKSMNDYVRTSKPWLEGRIRLLRPPFKPQAARVFDAATLKATLEPYVNGQKCGSNVCPHVHAYLYVPS